MGPRANGDTALRRDLGLLDAVGIGYGAIVGAGIFVVTGVAAGIAGPALLVGLFIAALAATANALSSAQLAAVYPQAGGTYEYGYRVLSPWFGYIAGWMFLVSKISAAGAVAKGLSGYVGVLAPGLPPDALAAGAIVLVTGLNYAGVKRSSRANLAVVAVTLSALVVLVAAGLPRVDAAHFTPFAPAGWQGAMEGAAVLFFAFTGYARIATLAEEVHDPSRTIPRAIVITLGGAVLLYAAVAFVAVGVIGADALAGSSAPLVTVAESLQLPFVVVFVSAGAATAMLGVMLSQILGLSRMAFAMARRGDLPAGLADVHSRHQVPARAVLAIGAAALLVATTGTLRDVASSASFAILVYYAIANLAAWRMSPADKRYPDFVPIAGLAACIVLAAALPWPVIAMGLAVLAAGVVARLSAGPGRRRV